MKMYLFVIFVTVTGMTTIQADNSIQHCGDFKAQQLLDIEMLFGKWYATELIYHDREEIHSNTFHDECPVLFLDEVVKDKVVTHHNYRDNENYNYQNQHQHQHQHHHTDNQEESLNWDELMEPLLKVWKEQKNNDKYQRRTTTIRPNEDIDDFKKQTLRRLRLIWNGDGNGARSEYSLRYNESRPGYWMSFGSQSDTMYNYTPFIGTIQVLKAVRAQTVLTFCHISKKHDFFTVVVSREPWLNRTDLNHIHQMLERKQLPIRHVRSMCMEYRNHCGKNQFNIYILFIGIVIISFIFRINT